MLEIYNIWSDIWTADLLLKKPRKIGKDEHFKSLKTSEIQVILFHKTVHRSMKNLERQKAEINLSTKLASWMNIMSDKETGLETENQWIWRQRSEIGLTWWTRRWRTHITFPFGAQDLIQMPEGKERTTFIVNLCIHSCPWLELLRYPQNLLYHHCLICPVPEWLWSVWPQTDQERSLLPLSLLLLVAGFGQPLQWQTSSSLSLCSSCSFASLILLFFFSFYSPFFFLFFYLEVIM